jgi:hypothetical protein
MAISNTTINTNLQAIYTSTGDSAVVTGYFCNISANPATFSVHVVPNGDSAGSSNIIYSNVNLTAEDTYVWDTEKLILGNGDSIWAVASDDGVIVATICNVAV